VSASTNLAGRPATKRGIPPVALWTALLAIPIVAILLFAILQPVKVRPRMGLAPGFSLVDQQGAALTNEDLRGKIALYNFTYANCDQPECRDSMATMQGVQTLLQGLDTAGIAVEQVTVSIDPARDTPDQLQRFADEWSADPATWHFLTGEPTRLKNVVGGGFGVFYEPGAGDQFNLAPALVLVDGMGIVRAKYKTVTPPLADVERDIQLIVAEVQNSAGPQRLVYEAAHLFLCYPKS
jgi:protein SCO1/2